MFLKSQGIYLNQSNAESITHTFYVEQLNLSLVLYTTDALYSNFNICTEDVGVNGNRLLGLFPSGGIQGSGQESVVCHSTATT